MNKDVKLHTFGSELMMLYGRINLSQGEFASAVGVSSVALRKWESGQSCPKAESVKRVIEILLHKGAFKQGAEQTEALHLWELAMQRGLKAPFDEVWFAMISGPVGAVPGADRVPCSTRDQGEEENPTVPPVSSSVDNDHQPSRNVKIILDAGKVYNNDKIYRGNFIGKDDNVSVTDPVLPYTDLNPASPKGLTLAPIKTRGRHKGLLVMLIVLVILLIIGLVILLTFSRFL